VACLELAGLVDDAALAVLLFAAAVVSRHLSLLTKRDCERVTRDRAAVWPIRDDATVMTTTTTTSMLTLAFAIKQTPRRWQFNSQRIYIRLRVGQQSGGWPAAGSQCADCL